MLREREVHENDKGYGYYDVECGGKQNSEKEKTASMDEVLSVSERLIRQNMEAYEVLAK